MLQVICIKKILIDKKLAYIKILCNVVNNYINISYIIGAGMLRGISAPIPPPKIAFFDFFTHKK